ncbi:uracil-DNA glycosylase family protein [Aliarcobacter butzleri]|uniref:uracil-DNA glycosylase family protein n=1 Tax=Aliarcobacter butzleri TaxID=28197 RepID=UPI0021B67921|nr:uracil-DNA glycosylase family protein [Aliarcobacter butzleri]MCT7566133.1 uracil-DNA glycosylase family protein [Aliarcobacter butzleri]
MELINNLNKLKGLIKNDNKLINMKGGIFYSDKKTLQKGKFYFLGVNPGGENAETLIEDLEKFETANTNYYLESWENGLKVFSPGEAPLQRRVKELFNKLNTSIENVCSSNLIFKQSKDLNNYDGNLLKDADSCWKIHELIINYIVQPEYIITHGKYVYEYLIDNQNFKEIKTFNSGHGNWTIKIAKRNNITLINLPHLSYYSPFTKNKRKENAIKELLKFIK